MLDISNIPSARVPVLDDKGLMTRQWYRYFFNLFNLTNAGSSSTNADDLALAPVAQSSVGVNLTSATGTLGTANGGTGLAATPSNGQLLIGNGTGFTLNTLTAGTGVTLTNGAGTITVAAAAASAAANLTGGVAGSLPYQSGVSTTTFLPIGTASQVLQVNAGATAPEWTTPSGGTVTSVGFTGGVVSVATPTTTPAFTVAGTSGGIPYFSSATTWATSAALAANALVVGGGAAVAPSTVTTGTNVLTALGVNVGTAGAVVVNGGVLGTPSSGTVTNLTGTASININGSVGATTASTGAFTTLSASSTVSGTGFTTYLASPPAIGGTTAAAITGTTITANTGLVGPHNGTVGATTPATGVFTTIGGTTITASVAFSGPHNGTVGATTPATGAFTTLTANSNSTFTGGHGKNAFGAVDAAALLALNGNATGATTAYSLYLTQAVQTDVTAFFDSIRCAPSLAAATATGTLRGFNVIGATLGAGASITNQVGFNAAATINTGTNNYGFFGNLAAATGSWNYYASGTANNAYAGNSRFGGVTVPVATVDVTGSVAATTTILSTGATSGVGYATGAGLSTTQLTSRTTGVTINAICGKITLFSATTTAGTFASFTVTNSAVAATDVVIVNIGSGATANSYSVTISAVAAGSFRVQIANAAAVAVAEAPVLNFAVIKAVTA